MYKVNYRVLKSVLQKKTFLLKTLLGTINKKAKKELVF